MFIVGAVESGAFKDYPDPGAHATMQLLRAAFRANLGWRIAHLLENIGTFAALFAKIFISRHGENVDSYDARRVNKGRLVAV